LKHSTIINTPYLLSSLIACAAIITNHSLAQEIFPTWTLCTRELELIETLVTKADERQIVTLDELGVRRKHAVDDLFFAIKTPTQSDQSIRSQDEIVTVPLADSTPSLSITLVDGQRIRGSLLDPNNDDSLLLSMDLGSGEPTRATIPLENILTIADRWDLPEQPKNESDTITTKNNDVLVGFVESVAPQTTITTGRATVTLDLNQIHTIGFANLPKRVAGIYLSTSDGLELRSSSFDFDFQHPMTIAVDGESLGLPHGARDLWMLNPDAPAGVHVVHPNQRVLSLSAIKPELVEPTGDRSWTPTPTVLYTPDEPVMSTIDLHAPVRLLYPLPKGSTRFACSFKAPINTWTDCIASVYSISYAGQRHELLVQQLNAEHPSQSLNAPLPPMTEKLEIRIDPGVNGPIQDRVLVLHPRLLIENTP